MASLFKQFFFVTCLFGIGLSIGVSWKLGYLPISLTSLPTAKLVEDPATEPTVASHNQDDQADAAIFSQQSEPGLNDTAAPLADADQARDHARRIARQGRSATSSAGRTSSNEDAATNSNTDFESATPRARRADPSAAAAAADDHQPAPPPPRSGRVKPASFEEPKREPAAETDTRPPRVASREANPASKDATSAVDIEAIVQEINEKLASGENLAAHKLMSKLYWSQPEFRPKLHKKLDASAQAIFFSPKDRYLEYVVQPGDQLRSIANKYQLSWEYLSQLNRVEPKRIQAGQKLKVVKGPFAAVVDLNDFALTIHLQGYYVKRYSVGVGKDNSSPIGKFTVLNKVENPQYTDPQGKVIAGDDPTNPLGERWLDLGGGYGIHGTIEPDSIGKAASRGCIRLKDEDIIEVYNLLVKGSEVVIRQ